MSTEQCDRARWFLEVIVRPTVAECAANQADVRRGFLAAIVVSHLADYLFEAATGPWEEGPDRWKDEKERKRALDGRRKALDRFRRDLAQENPNFLIVSDVANAAKHVSLAPHQGRVFGISPPSVDAVQAKTQEVWGLGHGSRARGTVPDADGKVRYRHVVVRHRDGSDWFLHGVVQEAMWFLEKKLAASVT